MSAKKFITGGLVVFPDKIKESTLVIDNGKIIDTDYHGEIPQNAEIIDAREKYVMPGFVEIHLHGGGGYDFTDATVEAFEKISETHRIHGVTSFMPTTVSCEDAALEKLFNTYRKAKEKDTKMHYLGIHLEGPFISHEMKGAQNPNCIKKPTVYETDKLLELGSDIIKMCTAAPELDGIDYMAQQMQRNNIVMSSGHSNATFEDIEKARSFGFRHITHMYSNTPSVRKINQIVHAGVLEAAYFYDDIKIELIGDGHHVPAEVLQLALKIKGADNINITSDAMRAAGTDVKESYLGEIKEENRVIIEDGVAKLPDRSFFAGSIATGDTMLKWLINKCNVSLNDAAKMLSLTPASIVGENKKIGSIEKGKYADIILLNDNLDVVEVVNL